MFHLTTSQYHKRSKMRPCQLPPPPSSPLKLFMHELRKQRNSESIHIEVDNAKSPSAVVPKDTEESSSALHRNHSMPTMQSGSSFDRKRSQSGGRPPSSRNTSASPIFSDERKRPTSMPTMSRKNSASRWEHGCYSSRATEESMNAPWTSVEVPPPPHPRRRLSAEDRTAIHLLPKNNTIEADSSNTASHADQLPDYQMALKLVQQKYAKPAPQRASSFSGSPSSAKTTLGSLPALPMRRESLDETMDLFDIVELM